MTKYFWVFLVGFVSFTALLGPSGSWAWRRRRSCSPRNCVLNTYWTNAGRCSRTCGGGRVLQRKSVRIWPYCGGRACPPYNSPQRVRYGSCNTRCCRVSCIWTWSSWGSCSGCGISRQTVVRCVFCDILDAGERRVQLFGVRRGAAILECKLTSFVLLISSE